MIISRKLADHRSLSGHLRNPATAMIMCEIVNGRKNFYAPKIIHPVNAVMSPELQSHAWAVVDRMQGVGSHAESIKTHIRSQELSE